MKKYIYISACAVLFFNLFTACQSNEDMLTSTNNNEIKGKTIEVIISEDSVNPASRVTYDGSDITDEGGKLKISWVEGDKITLFSGETYENNGIKNKIYQLTKQAGNNSYFTLPDGALVNENSIAFYPSITDESTKVLNTTYGNSVNFRLQKGTLEYVAKNSPMIGKFNDAKNKITFLPATVILRLSIILQDEAGKIAANKELKYFSLSGNCKKVNGVTTIDSISCAGWLKINSEKSSAEWKYNSLGDVSIPITFNKGAVTSDSKGKVVVYAMCMPQDLKGMNFYAADTEDNIYTGKQITSEAKVEAGKMYTIKRTMRAASDVKQADTLVLNNPNFDIAYTNDNYPYSFFWGRKVSKTDGVKEDASNVFYKDDNVFGGSQCMKVYGQERLYRGISAEGMQTREKIATLNKNEEYLFTAYTYFNNWPLQSPLMGQKLNNNEEYKIPITQARNVDILSVAKIGNPNFLTRLDISSWGSIMYVDNVRLLKVNPVNENITD